MIVTKVSFIALLVNWYNNRLFPLIGNFFLFQIELMSLRISLPGYFCLFVFAIAVSTSEGLGSDTNGSAVCICLRVNTK
jgi:hypothetical protein